MRERVGEGWRGMEIEREGWKERESVVYTRERLERPLGEMITRKRTIRRADPSRVQVDTRTPTRALVVHAILYNDNNNSIQCCFYSALAQQQQPRRRRHVVLDASRVLAQEDFI